jgi:hypothetical protein
MPLDLVLAGPGLEEQFFARAVERRVGDVIVPVASAEDLVAMRSWPAARAIRRTSPASFASGVISIFRRSAILCACWSAPWPAPTWWPSWSGS